MRQMLIQIPSGRGEQFVEIARGCNASTLTRVDGSGGRHEPVELFVVTIPNANVGPLLQRARDLGRIEASMASGGALAFEPPAGEAPEELLDVSSRSSLEVVLAGRQASGSWTGFLTYAAAAGAVVWLGLFTETIYLLTGSMLIAPFAGPAMNTAIAISSGRTGLLRHSVMRYLTGILLTATVAGLLTLVAGQDVVTGLMSSVLTLSPAAVLLPLVAGVAGATFLVQSEHSSLISGAAVGVLVAASLAPPAGGMGMALAMGRVDLAVHGAWLVALQLAGITLSAVIVMWLYGLRPDERGFGGGRPWLLRGGLVAAALATAGLVAVQIAASPELQQGGHARNTAEVVAQALADREDAQLLNVASRVASSDVGSAPRILVELAVERTAGAEPVEELRRDLEQSLTQTLRQELPSVVHHVDVTVHDPPS